MLGVLAGSDINSITMQHGGSNRLIARTAPTQRKNGILGISVELPEQLRLAGAQSSPRFPFLGMKAIRPAIAAIEDYLRHASKHSHRRGGPVAVVDIFARKITRPQNLTGLLVECNKAGGLRRRYRNVILGHAITGADEQRFLPNRDAAG